MTSPHPTADQKQAIPADIATLAEELRQQVRCHEKPLEAEALIASALIAERERCAQICEEQRQVFLSPQYATNQPFSSFAERLACTRCAEAIRAEA